MGDCADCGEPGDGRECESCRKELCGGCLDAHAENGCPPEGECEACGEPCEPEACDLCRKGLCDRCRSEHARGGCPHMVDEWVSALG